MKPAAPRAAAVTGQGPTGARWASDVQNVNTAADSDSGADMIDLPLLARPLSRVTLGLSALLLAACGGGGDSGPPNANATVIGPNVNVIQPAAAASCAELLIGQAPGASCTLLTTSIFNGVPVDAGNDRPGTVTTASIRVGPATGRMRFVRLSNLFSNDPNIGAICCSPAQYGPVFVPQANAVTTVTLNFPMVWEPRRPPGDIRLIRQDRIGLEILDFGVPLPIAAFSGQAATFVWRPALSERLPAGSLEAPIPSSPVGNFIPTFSYAFVPG